MQELWKCPEEAREIKCAGVGSQILTCRFLQWMLGTAKGDLQG
jgi:hypothetical protein